MNRATAKKASEIIQQLSKIEQEIEEKERMQKSKSNRMLLRLVIVEAEGTWQQEMEGREYIDLVLDYEIAKLKSEQQELADDLDKL